MKMIKHASLFKWPNQNGASKMTNLNDGGTSSLVSSKSSSNGKHSSNNNNNNSSHHHQTSLQQLQQQHQNHQNSSINSSSTSSSTSSSASSTLSSAAMTTAATASQQSNNGHNTAAQQKLWLHPPATLQNGHIAYLVKYFGNVEVNQPKGIDVVKESINKLKFIQPIKKSEGNKIPKVELTISVNGVAIQEPKTKKIYCQFPLHRISYCADDKTEKKFFSFIAKDVDTDKHLCFVFMSEKMSEEIILTIGQAFDLAYAKFIETSGRELEIRKQLIMLQKKVCHLEENNRKLKERLKKYEPVDDVDDEDGNEENGNGNGVDDKDKDKKDATSAKAIGGGSANGVDGDKKSSPLFQTTPQQNGTGGDVDSILIKDTSSKQTTNGHANKAQQQSLATTNSTKLALSSVPVPPPLQPPPSSKTNRSMQQINLIDVDIECNDNTASLLMNNSLTSMANNDPISSSNNIKLISDLFDEDFNPRADDNNLPPPSQPPPPMPPVMMTLPPVPAPTLPIPTAAVNLMPTPAPTTIASTLNNNQQQKNLKNFSPIDKDFGASITQEKDIFGCEPFKVQDQDPFGMPNWSDLDSAIVNIDKKLAEMRDGFSQGLSADGFNLDT